MLRPLSLRNWNPAYAAHLLNRAGFGGSPAEVRAAARRRPDHVVDELLDFQQEYDPIPPPTWLTPDSKARPNRKEVRKLSPKERQKFNRKRNQLERERMVELRAWWLYRMRYSAKPLQEKLTLFWHGHFATSAQKVRSTYAMYQQNQTFRRLAHGNWRDLVAAVAKDPAMLIYLDNARSHREAPNENFARELMELFTLGEGNYTEDDIKEAARAFTGWTLHREEFTFVNRSRLHDSGTKRFFGRTGRFDGNDIVDIIIRQPTSAEFIVNKLWTFFAYDQPDRHTIRSLADTLRNGGYELQPVLREMFLSEAFYSASAFRTQIKSPVQWLVGSAKVLEAPLPSGGACNRALKALGQELFAPPNVKGWDGGYTWITTATLLHRYNFAGALVQGGEGPYRLVKRVVDVNQLLSDAERASTEKALTSLQNRLFQAPLREQDKAAFRAYTTPLPPAPAWSEEDLQKVVHIMMSTPQYQLT